MAFLNFICKKCNKERQRYFQKVPKFKTWGFCDCGGELIRQPLGPTSQVMESLDNGVMRKAVERYSEAERLYRERQKADPSKKTTEYV